MANSNKRNKECETIHHLVSRIAHRVYFLKETERMDLLEIIRRASEFTGIRLLGWCVMGNHFHILVYLPAPMIVDEGEVLSRYGILKGAKAERDMETAIAEWRSGGESGLRRIEEWMADQRKRMYSVASFMKIVKQWFTVEYNRRNAHKGTLWEAAYFDRVVARNEADMAKCLAYIHLNPIRAAATDKFDGYPWSSYTAFRRGDATAISGMRFVYGEEIPDSEIELAHEALLESLLEEEKLRRAEEIARKRASGYEMPADPLTDEAMIAQTAARLAEVQKASMVLRNAQSNERRRKEKGALREEEILALIKSNPDMDVPSLAERLSVGLSMAYLLVGRLKKQGRIRRDRRSGKWIF